MTRMNDIDNFIRSTGLEAYRVGGSVRDELLGRRPKDADYVVRNSDLGDLAQAVVNAGAQPSALKLRDGRQVGVRAAVRGMGLIEIALPRTEISTGPTRHDFKIVTDPTLPLSLDAVRRDFTINALYRDLDNGEVVDPLKLGRDALRAQVIQTTHPDSFRDDPLRILRALRFFAQIRGFRIADATLDEMERHAAAVTGMAERGVSGTAVDELNKLLMGSRAADALRLMRDTGVMAEFLPELAPMIGFDQQSRYHDKSTDEHTFDALDAAVRFHASLRVRLALLFHDAGKPEVAWMGKDERLHYYRPSEALWEELGGFEANDDVPENHEEAGARIADAVMKRLPYPKDLRKDVVTLIERHMVPLNGRTKPTKVRRWRADLGDDLLRDLFKMRVADVIGKGDEVDEQSLAAIARLEAVRHGAERDGVPVNAKGLKLSGGDLKTMGFEGREIGEVQRKLLHAVLAQPKLNSEEWLRQEAERQRR